MFSKTADSIISKFTKTVSELEAHGQSKEAEHHRLHELAQAAKGEYTRAYDYASKLKKIFN